MAIPNLTGYDWSQGWGGLQAYLAGQQATPAPTTTPVTEIVPAPIIPSPIAAVEAATAPVAVVEAPIPSPIAGAINNAVEYASVPMGVGDTSFLDNYGIAKNYIDPWATSFEYVDANGNVLGKGYDTYEDAIRKLAFTSGLQTHAPTAARAPSGMMGFDEGYYDPGSAATPEQYSWNQYQDHPEFRFEGIGVDPGQDTNFVAPPGTPRFNTKQELYDYLLGQPGDLLSYESKEKYGRDLTEGQLQNMYARYASGNLVGAVPDWTYHREAYNTQNTPGIFTEAPKSGYRIAGEQALVGSTPVFGVDGKIVGYKINANPEHINLADTSGRVQSSTSGATNWDPSLKNYAYNMGDGTIFVKAEDIGKVAYNSTGTSTYSKDPNFFDKYMPGIIQSAALNGIFSGLSNALGGGVSDFFGGIGDSVTGSLSDALGIGADFFGEGTAGAVGDAAGWGSDFLNSAINSVGKYISDPTKIANALISGGGDIEDAAKAYALGLGTSGVSGGTGGLDIGGAGSWGDKIAPGAVATTFKSLVTGGDVEGALTNYLINAGFKLGTSELSAAAKEVLGSLGVDKIDPAIMDFEEQYANPDEIDAIGGNVTDTDNDEDYPVGNNPDEVDDEDYPVGNNPDEDGSSALTPEQVEEALQQVLAEDPSVYTPPTQAELDAWAAGDKTWLNAAVDKLVSYAANTLKTALTATDAEQMIRTVASPTGGTTGSNSGALLAALSKMGGGGDNVSVSNRTIERDDGPTEAEIAMWAAEAGVSPSVMKQYLANSRKA